MISTSIASQALAISAALPESTGPDERLAGMSPYIRKVYAALPERPNSMTRPEIIKATGPPEWERKASDLGASAGWAGGRHAEGSSGVFEVLEGVMGFDALARLSEEEGKCWAFGESRRVVPAEVAREVVSAIQAERDDLAARLAELEGQEPTAWMNAKQDMVFFINFHDDDLPLFARPVPAEPVNARLLDVAVWPAGYCRDPNGKMSIPAGKEEDFNFGYDVGFQEAWEILNSAISAEGEEQMTDVTKDLLEALKAAQAYVCGPTAWTQEQEDTLVEAMSKAIARDDVIRMARDAGFFFHDAGHAPILHTNPLGYSEKCFERFAHLVIADFLRRTGQYVTNDASREAVLEQVRAEEREACAKVCEESGIPFGIDVWMNSTKKEMTAATANALAAAIRARGQK